ncbi:hypothetical protein SRABI106_04868 [Rahnella aquatilis]|nr:hypothetical protein SRABI106_04868 [Rahnella aquatilis]
MALVITFTAPDHCIFIPRHQSFDLQIQLTQAELCIIIQGVFIIIGAVRHHTDHRVDVKTHVVFLVNFAAQFDFAVGVIFVTQTPDFVFLELFQTATARNPQPRTQISMEINIICHSRARCDGEGNRHSQSA